jgi:hypothetical protein
MEDRKRNRTRRKRERRERNLISSIFKGSFNG